MRENKSNMPALVRAEHLKMKHTFVRILPAASALVALFLVFSFSRGVYFAVSAWNWWYTMLLPGMLAILCYLVIKREKKLHYCNLLSAPLAPSACLFGKILYCTLSLCLANLLLAFGTLVADMVWGSGILPVNSLAAAALLSICSLWEIPFFLMVSARFGVFVNLFSGMVLTLGATVMLAGSGLWWLCPAAIPVRLMCPVLGILPNGLTVPADSPLWDPGVVLPGIVLSMLWFAVLTAVAGRILWKGEKGAK